MSRKSSSSIQGQAQSVGSKAVAEALQFIRNLVSREENKLSFSEIASILRHTDIEALRTTHRVTVARWLQWEGKEMERIHPLTKNVIVQAARQLMAWEKRPEEIRVGLIEHATELIPLHVLVHLSQNHPKAIGGMDVKPVYKNSVEELLLALKADEVDFIAAPRHVYPEEQHSDYTNLEREPLKRFFKIATIKTHGIFPFPGSESGAAPRRDSRELVEVLNRFNRMRPQRLVGVLPNVAYDKVVATFVERNDTSALTRPVANYQEAFELLRNAEIGGCVGHPIFIKNVMALVKKAKKGKEHLRDLGVFEGSGFDQVKVEIFVNLPAMEKRRNRAAMIFHALCEAMDYINEHKSIGGTLNDLLNLKEAPACTAEDIFSWEHKDSYRFNIETFRYETLRRLWKWKPVHGERPSGGG